MLEYLNISAKHYQNWSL